MIAKLKTPVTCASLSLLLAACMGDPTREAAKGANHPLDVAGGYASIVKVADATAAAGDCGTAVGLYRRASETWPLDADVRLKLAHCFANLRAYDEAITSYQVALRLAPSSVEARRGIGNVFIALDQAEMALPHFKAAQKLDPKDARIYNSIGVIYDMQGDHRAAQSQYRTGLDAQPGTMSLINNLGLSLALSGDYQEAVAVLKPAAAHPNAGPRTRQNLALVYGLAGENELAARVARVDLDEVSVRKNIAYYSTLRQLKDKARLSAIGAVTAPGPNSATPSQQAR